MWRHSTNLLNPPSQCYLHEQPRFEPPPDFVSPIIRIQFWSKMSSPFVKSYLVAYNFLQASSWYLSLLPLSLAFFRSFIHEILCSSSRTISLLSIVSSVLSNKTISGAYSAAGYLISERSSLSLMICSILILGFWSVLGYYLREWCVLDWFRCDANCCCSWSSSWSHRYFLMFMMWLDWMSYESNADWLLLFEMLKGIVPSGFLSPMMQWSGRTHFILAIVGQISEVCVCSYSYSLKR